MRKFIGPALFLAAVLLISKPDVHAFQQGGPGGCGMGECRDCHSLDTKEASSILGNLVDNVLKVEESPIRGLWVVDIQRQGKKFPVYVDYSKGFLISGQVVRLSTREDITGTRFETLNKVAINISEIPLGESLVMGNPDAKRKVIVFSDPDCSFCGKLHHEMKTVVEKAPDVAFFIKLYSRSNNPVSATKAKAVICSKSLAMLDDAYAGKKLPAPSCETHAAEDHFKLAQKLNIRGTPTLVMPNGDVVSGYRTADVLLKMLAGEKPGNPAGSKPAGSKKGAKKKK